LPRCEFSWSPETIKAACHAHHQVPTKKTDAVLSASGTGIGQGWITLAGTGGNNLHLAYYALVGP
jgi:hypothetical protein